MPLYLHMLESVCSKRFLPPSIHLGENLSQFGDIWAHLWTSISSQDKFKHSRIFYSLSINASDSSHAAPHNSVWFFAYIWVQAGHFSLVMGIIEPTGTLWSLMLSAQRKGLLAGCPQLVYGKLEACALLLGVIGAWPVSLPFLHSWSGPLSNAFVLLELKSNNKPPPFLEILEYA